MSEQFDKSAVVTCLDRILELELAGVVRYTHYSLMVFGYNRIPIVSWMRGQATESLAHAQQAGEMITHMGEHPSLGIGSLLQPFKGAKSHDLRPANSLAVDTCGVFGSLIRLGAGFFGPRGCF